MTALNVVYFDSASNEKTNSYVVRSSRPHRGDTSRFKVKDRLGRTEEDKKFLDQFIKIFNAASTGDLHTCQQVVQDGYCDFDTFIIGLPTSNNASIDKISPLQIAINNKHQAIVDYFNRINGNSSVNQLSKSAAAFQALSKDTHCQKPLCLQN